VRLPTWCPFRLQFYCNGHSYLARQMDKGQIGYRALDNAFGWIADFDKAQKLADEFRVEMLHRKLDDFATRYCPVLKQFELSYHWSLDQVEFATDIVFRKQSDLQAIYGRLTRGRDSYGQTGQHRHLPGTETERQLPGRDGQPVQHAYRRDAHQAHHGAGVDQNVVSADPAHRDHRGIRRGANGLNSSAHPNRPDPHSAVLRCASLASIPTQNKSPNATIVFCAR
jgi:hypothetical protein